MTTQDEHLAADSPRRIFYAHGPGDASGSLRAWARSEHDDSIIAIPYSGQFFDVCDQFRAEALLVADRPAGTVSIGSFTVEGLPFQTQMRGWRYRLAKHAHTERLAERAAAFGADVALLHGHYGLSAPAAFDRKGIPAIVSMHNTLWPMGTRPSIQRRALYRLERGRARRSIRAALAVSPECARQLHQAVGPRVPVTVHVPQYPSSLLDRATAPHERSSDELRIVFAGRLEMIKGVMDVVQAADLLRRRGVTKVRWVIAGSGPLEATIRSEIEARDLADAVQVVGHLRREQLAALYSASHATITPTRTGFAEGMAKAPLEAVLYGMPAIVTSVVPAGEVIAAAAIVVPPATPEAIAKACEQLLDAKQYDRFAQSAERLRRQLFQPERSFARALQAAIAKVTGWDHVREPLSERSSAR